MIEKFTYEYCNVITDTNEEYLDEMNTLKKDGWSPSDPIDPAMLDLLIAGKHGNTFRRKVVTTAEALSK
jgi:hypothetical protein